jgi:hypothetical protein
MSELGRLKRIDPRKVWKDEAKDFTPWLRENIGLLSEAIGLDIDLVEREVGIGGFAADLVGQEPTTKKPVVIENQLSRTDHDHLGKLLTYASGTDAGTSIWIATDFRDEHKQTLEWLNNISAEGIYFFGIQLQLLQVDDSLPAPNFDMVVSPPAVKPQGIAQVTPRMRAYRDFFSGLLEELKARKPGLTNASKVGYANWLGISAGRSGFFFSISFAQARHFRVELYIDTGDREKNGRAFDALLENRAQIEEAIGKELAWERLETARASRVALYWPESATVMDGQDRLTALKDWAIETVARFKQVLGAEVAGLPL